MFTGMIPIPALGTETEYHAFTRTPEVQIRRSFATGNETPAPVDLGPSGVYVTSTGQILLMQSTDVLVRDALKYVKDTAVLPIDENDEAIVDRLVARRLASVRTKPLTRKM